MPQKKKNSVFSYASSHLINLKKNLYLIFEKNREKPIFNNLSLSNFYLKQNNIKIEKKCNLYFYHNETIFLYLEYSLKKHNESIVFSQRFIFSFLRSKLAAEKILSGSQHYNCFHCKHPIVWFLLIFTSCQCYFKTLKFIKKITIPTVG